MVVRPRSYGKAPLRGRLLTRRPLTRRFLETPLITGKLTGRLGISGSPLRGGTVLTEGMVPYRKGRGPLRSFTEKDDEEAYRKAGPLREASYEEGRSLREGSLILGPRSLIFILGRDP